MSGHMTEPEFWADFFGNREYANNRMLSELRIKCANLERRIVRRKRGVTKLRARLQVARHELLALELGR